MALAAMNETQRQSYLQTMGIQSYFPRVVLPGAKPSSQYDFDEVDNQNNLAADGREPLSKATDPGQPAAPAESSVLDEIRAGVSAGKGPSRKAADKVTAKADREEVATLSGPPAEEGIAANSLDSQNPVGEDAELRFSLNYFRITPTLALINEVPHQHSSAQDAQTMALMQAILLALSIDVQVADLRAENFSWPLSDDHGAESKSPQLAAKALSGFVQMRQHRDQFGDLLVFAGRAEELMLGDDSSRRDFRSACGNFNITVSKSLQSMLVHPALKKDVWKDLQPLRGRLSKSE